MFLRDQDETFLRQAIDLAWSARNKGNQPFGALLIDEVRGVLEVAENTIMTDHDPSRHAETNAITGAARKYGGTILKTATLYASTEPCLMCCGAIHWVGIPRIVFGCSAQTLARIIRSDDFLMPSREIFAKTSSPSVEIIGPLLEEEAIAVHTGFWHQ